MNNYTTFIDKSQHYKFIIFLDMSEETRVLEIHTLNYNLFLKEKLIAIGWNKIGDLSQHRIRQSAERLLVGADPEPPLKNRTKKGR